MADLWYSDDTHHVFTAVPAGTRGVDVDKEQQPRPSNSLSLPRLQRYSFCLGFMTGFFLESAALSAHLLIVASRGVDGPSPSPYLLCLLLSLVTSLMPFVLVVILRALFADLYQAPNQNVTWHMECFVGLGTLLGACLAALALDAALGLSDHLRYSTGILVLVAVPACLFFIRQQGQQFKVENEKNDHQGSVVPLLTITRRLASMPYDEGTANSNYRPETTLLVV